MKKTILFPLNRGVQCGYGLVQGLRKRWGGGCSKDSEEEQLWAGGNGFWGFWRGRSGTGFLQRAVPLAVEGSSGAQGVAMAFMSISL